MTVRIAKSEIQALTRVAAAAVRGDSAEMPDNELASSYIRIHQLREVCDYLEYLYAHELHDRGIDYVLDEEREAFLFERDKSVEDENGISPLVPTDTLMKMTDVSTLLKGEASWS